MKFPSNEFRTIRAAAILPALLLSTLGQAAEKGGDHGAGNAGGAWICRDAAGKITRAELVDLWEAENDPALKLQIVRSSDPVDTQIEKALLKLEAGTALRMRAVIQSIQKKMSLGKLGQGAEVPQTEDPVHSIRPREAEYCGPNTRLRYEQIVVYRDDETMLVNQEIFENPAFSNTDRAALYMHESVYLKERQRLGAQDSRRARKATGRLFSTEALSKVSSSALRDLSASDTAFSYLKVSKDASYFVVARFSARADDGEELYTPYCWWLASSFVFDRKTRFALNPTGVLFQQNNAPEGSSHWDLASVLMSPTLQNRYSSSIDIILACQMSVKRGFFRKQSTVFSEGEFSFSKAANIVVTLEFRDSDSRDLFDKRILKFRMEDAYEEIKFGEFLGVPFYFEFEK